MRHRRFLDSDLKITTSIRAPCCERCHKHMMFMAQSGAMQFALRFFVVVGWIVYAAIVWPLKRLIARRWRGPGCVPSLRMPRSHLSGSAKDRLFSFESPAVARAFAEANREKLVDPSPALQALLAAEKGASRGAA